MRTISWDKIENLRDIPYRRNKNLQVKSEVEALKFINDVGFCFAFAAKNSELPCLWHAVCGERNPRMPEHIQHDWSIGLVWHTKDILPAKKKTYYGKALKRRPTMISLEYFPYFYRIKREEETSTAYIAQYMRGDLSPAARKIMDTLTEFSPQVTRELKQSSGFSHPQKRYEFDRAMAELQMEMFVVKIGELYDPFMFLWDLVAKRFEKGVKTANQLTVPQAREKILTKYFSTVLVSRNMNIQRLFGWRAADIEVSLRTLLEKKIIHEIKVVGEKQIYYSDKSIE